MNKDDLNEARGSAQLSELDQVIKQEELFESLRPTPFRGLMYTFFIIACAVLYILFGLSLDDERVFFALIVAILFAPLDILAESRKTNKRIDALHYLVRKKYATND